jgi:hypothetical protein
MTTDTAILPDVAIASSLIRLHANDDVLIARAPLALGQALPELGLRLRAQVPAGHKIARAASPRASRCASTTPSSARRSATSRPASTCTRTTWR